MKGQGINIKWYGWRILVLATLAHYFGWAATTLHSFGLFVIPVSREFSWSRAEISLASTIGSIAMVLVAPFIGYMMDRFGPRLVMIPSTLLLGLLLSALWLSNGSLLYFYAIFTMLAVLGAGTIGPVYARLIFSWFELRKGLALGIVLGGAAASTAINPPLLNWIIQNFGWRDAYLVMGLVNLLIIFPLLLLFLRNTPADVGEARDGMSGSSERPDSAAEIKDSDHGYDFATAIRTATFWKIAGTFFILAFGQSAVVHLIPLLQSTGIDSQTAALAASVFGGTMLVSRLASGVLMDRFHAAKIGAVVAGLSGIGFLLLLLLPGSVPIAFLAAIFLGLVYGAESDFMGFLVVTYFGRRAAGRLHTTTFSIFACGNAAGVYCTGLLFDSFNSYAVPLVIALGTAVVATLILLSFGPYPVPARTKATSQVGLRPVTAQMAEGRS